ncbi:MULTISPECIES: phosphatidylglycerophosphatase C [unclassified Brenneria]|uniref:phosphatidylglycerophosphatase C n=1 Tax=unclassified Brenneria TaxID=2634434 RepID=UPI001555A9A5|nr:MULTISPECIES: phosphatidylglycerophosphatase C [unclassified Brenneria]MEE3645087.1 phosphatidylglycerophosphatase C [Brenneria sp. L3_3C_1]MEE3652730.1 phosphatidylglycerophosphatase C [Brenneria sp. HEZEL_4_2_4]MBJ7223842.1 acid phosphatase AphA [Brenneria sp. L3-3C-1]MEE3652855.1 phosphatidylglycerophosphatase C [Brenneria sp. HEZEL_4_2_4]NPD02686.1 acid phosphatase AphA [Brenneria sp. hezel4-2-4]
MSDKRSLRIVFFDLDGTLHQQDMFGSFLRFLLKRLPLNLILVLPLLPVIGAGLLVRGRAARWPMSWLLWAITFGRREDNLVQLEKQFVSDFRRKVTPFPQVQQRLKEYLQDTQAQVWLVTGSPQRLVEQVYHDSPFLPGVRLMGSQITRRAGGWVLTLRCLGQEKVIQMEQRLGTPLKLYSGYSDSKQDNPLLYFCEHRWRVTPNGSLQQLE